MKKILCAAALAAVAAMVLAATASADVPRYQAATLTVSLTAIPGNVHTFALVVNPVDGSFAGTGQGSATAGGANETIQGTLVGNQLTFTAVYVDFLPGYTYTYNGLLTGGTLSIGYAATFGFTVTSYANHGDFVSQSTDKEAAAHSLVGKPVAP